MKHDFYYSKNAEARLRWGYNPRRHHHTEVKINNKWYTYSEMIDCGEKPLLPDNDLEFLGSADSSDTRIDHKED